MNPNQPQHDGFTYSYSAKEYAELKRIREKYTTKGKTEDKMARLRRLDASVAQTAQAAALVCGILGVLALGFGMSLIMTDLAITLALGRTVAVAIGLIVGILGGILAALAYPAYSIIERAKRKKLAPEILRLTDELLQ